MRSQDNIEEHTQKMSNKKLTDPFAELFTGPLFNTQKEKDNTPSMLKTRDDILFSKIDPFHLSLGKNKPGQEKGSIVFDEDNLERSRGVPLDVCNLRNDPILSSMLSKTVDIKTPTMAKKRTVNTSSDMEKTKQELLSLLSVNADLGPCKTPEDAVLRSLSQADGGRGEEFIASLFSKDTLIETPKSPNIDQLLAKEFGKPIIGKANSINEEGKGFSFTFGTQGNNGRAKQDKCSTAAKYKYGGSPQIGFRNIAVQSPEWREDVKGPMPVNVYKGGYDGMIRPNVQYERGYEQPNASHRLADRQDAMRGYRMPQQSGWMPPAEGQWMFVGQQYGRPPMYPPRAVIQADKRRVTKLRLKLFTLSRMNDEQRHYVESVCASGERLRYRFSRTMEEIARLLGLPRLGFSEVHELRLLYNLFSRYGGYLCVNAQFLNHMKEKMAVCFFRYLSYVLPFETGGYFYKRRINKKKRTGPTKGELNLVLCIGIYDDIFHFLETLERGEAVVSLTAELLNAFFLVSDSLLKKCEIHLPCLGKIISRLSGKPYRVVLERIPKRILYQLQEQLFRVIIKFEKSKRSERSLHEDTINCIIEVLMERSRLKKLPDICELAVPNEDSRGWGECERIWAMMLLGAVSTIVRSTPRILKILFESSDAGFVIKTAARVHMDSQALRHLFVKHQTYIITSLEQHMKSLEMLKLLNDNGEFEAIIICFLPFIFKNTMAVVALLNTIIRYREYLLMKRIYFRKKQSSNIEAVVRYLKRVISVEIPNGD